VRSKKKQAYRITVVSGSLANGGAERVAADLCRYLRDSGREVALLTLTGDEPDDYKSPEGVLRERMEVRRAPPSLFHRIFYLLGRLVSVRRRLVAFQPDVVVSFIDRINMLVLLALFGTGIPVIASERLHPGYNPIPRAWLLARKVIYLFAKAVTVQTEDGADWLRRHSWVRHPVVVPNAVRYSHDLGNRSGRKNQNVARPFVLAIGRLTEQKGFDLLLEAFHRSGLAQVGWNLVILGEGPALTDLKQQAAALCVADAVTFPGFVDVAPWLEQADIFVLSSRYEGFPNALMEAMQMQRACISFDCPSGPRDLIENERNGLLVPPLDVASLSKALQRLAGDPALRGRLGTEAVKVSERFSHDTVYGKWLGLIDAVATGDIEAQSASSFTHAPSWQADHNLQRSQPGEG
jgi:GalNAc-alpha-(1->4)-GalNAc-alpha-(1->3)-diNAcBac-PP-undecaprenol alpha-1,4-N-acetyl-D-galactosaminyltransferase